MSNKTALSSTSESGFTLVELLVVILIIGVLAAIAIPAYMNQRKEAANATLQSDMKNMATSYVTWSTTPGNNNERFYELAGNRHSSPIFGVNAKFGPESSNPWNQIEGGQPTTVSEGTYISTVVIGPSAKNSTWKRIHEEGEFCSAGNNIGSDYDFVTWSGMGAINYHRSLYYDSALGGVMTAQEIADAMLDGKMASCDGQIGAWMDAKGMNTADYWSKYAS